MKAVRPFGVVGPPILGGHARFDQDRLLTCGSRLLRFAEYTDTHLALPPSPVRRGWCGALGEGTLEGKRKRLLSLYYENTQ
jgi:hypothetical protein